MRDAEFARKLKRMVKIEHAGAQKEILWNRLYSRLGDSEKPRFWYFGFRFTYLVALVLVVLLATSGVTFASQNSLPGEPLYPVKRLSEEAKIFIVFDQRAKKKERIKLTTRRADEVQKLAGKDPKKAEEVLDDYESQMEKHEKEFNTDPELMESFNNTLITNKEVFVKTAETAPEQIKVRIRVLIKENSSDDPGEEDNGEVEGEQTSPQTDAPEETPSPPTQLPNNQITN